MADTKISALSAASTPLGGTEVLPIVQSSSTVNVSIANLTAGRSVSASALTLTNPLTIGNGGTGLTSFTANGVVYASSTSALATGSALTFDGTTFKVAKAGGVVGVNNLVYVDVTSSYGGITLNAATGQNNFIELYQGGTTKVGEFGVDAANSLINIGGFGSYNTRFYASGSEQMRLTSTGLGIGTSSPAQKLHVSATTPVVRIDATAAYNATPTATLAFVGTYNSGGGLDGFANISAVKTNATSGDGSAYLTFATNTSTGNMQEKMRIDSSGNLFVGTTVSAYTSGERLSISPASTKNGIGIAVSGTGAKGIGIYNGNSSGATNGTMIEFQNSSSVVVGSITSNGSTTAYNVTSDQRLKENIVDAPDFGGVIDSMQVRSFDWKSDGSHQRAGFIAQELVTVAPEAVHQPANEEDMMAVDYSKLVPMLVKEIQSLRKRILTLEIK